MKRTPFAVLAVSALLVGAGCKGRHAEDRAGSSAAVRVRTAPVTERGFRDVVRFQGTIAARDHARIAARIPGVLDDLFVREGDRVVKGQKLFQTDKANLERHVALEEQNVRVAEASVAEAAAALAAAEAAHEKAEADRRRFAQLYEKDKVVSRDAYEKVGLQFQQAAAALAHARAAAELTQARREQAKAALEIARKTLSDSLVLAPFDGVVSERKLEPGEFAGAGAAVLTLKGSSGFEARAHVPASYFRQVVAGETPAAVAAGGRDLGEFPVTLRSPTVDLGTRTFEIRVALTNAPGIVDGMACELALVLASRTGLGVPSSAIGVRNGQPIVFTVEGGLARQVPVTRGIVEGAYTELVHADAVTGKTVVVEGQTFLNDGTPIRTP